MNKKPAPNPGDNADVEMNHLVNSIPGGIAKYSLTKDGRFNTLYFSDGVAALTGHTREEYAERMQEDAAMIVYEEDRRRLVGAVIETLKSGRPIDETYRVYHKDGSLVWVRLNGVLIGEQDGEPLMYAVFQRPARMAKLYDNMVNESRNMIYVSDVDNYDLLYMNRTGLQAIGKETADYSGQKCYEFLFDRTAPCPFCRVSQMCAERYLERDFTYPKNGRTYFLRGKLTDWNGLCAHVEYLEDVTEIRSAERELRENQLRYEAAIKSSGINIWEYDIRRDVLDLISDSSRIGQNHHHIEKYVRTVIDHGWVREDSVDCFLGIFERLRQGEREVSGDIWYKSDGETGWWCERVTYTAVADEDGKPVKAFGAGRDVTREKEAEQKFHEELSYRQAMQSDRLTSVVIDLTDNRVLEVSSAFSAVSVLEGGTAEYYFEQTAKAIVGEAFVGTYVKLFNPRSLLNRFESGDYAVSMEMTLRYDTSQIYWIHCRARLVRNPETGHVTAHLSCVDITQEKVMQTIMETIVKADYDSLVVVDGSLDSALDYGAEEGKHLYDKHKSFEQQIRQWIFDCVYVEDVQMLLSECKIDRIWEQIKDGETHKFNFSMRMPDGTVRRKQLQFTAIASPCKTFLMSRIDVNDIYEEQQAAKEKLRRALFAAEQASRSKSAFLGRMSHDIRTPMNAVISLAALGQDSTSMGEARDSLRKIETSGQYLLAIINDVLALSKMENRRMEMHPEAVYVPDFIDGTVAIVMPTAMEKRIDLRVDQSGVTSRYIKMDVTHMRQVAVNLLSNAIKFTPDGGRVELVFETVSHKDGTAKNRMTVRDTGVGIDPAFLPRVFMPFEQENAQDDVDRKGTGLGLAIVKNIVEQMGGRVWAESEKGCGSAFYAEWPLEAATKKELRSAEGEAVASALLVLAGKRVLLAEDHPLNVEIAKKLLDRQAVAVETASNGQDALERFCASAPGYYDAVLMDIRMPVMNGLVAARAIRALARPDAKTVPMIAMTANAFDEDVRESIAAGMNAHLIKPIDPKKLYDTLAELILSNQDRMR